MIFPIKYSHSPGLSFLPCLLNFQKYLATAEYPHIPRQLKDHGGQGMGQGGNSCRSTMSRT
jgi:hypothetical protein